MLKKLFKQRFRPSAFDSGNGTTASDLAVMLENSPHEFFELAEKHPLSPAGAYAAAIWATRNFVRIIESGYKVRLESPVHTFPDPKEVKAREIAWHVSKQIMFSIISPSPDLSRAVRPLQKFTDPATASPFFKGPTKEMLEVATSAYVRHNLSLNRSELRTIAGLWDLSDFIRDKIAEHPSADYSLVRSLFMSVYAGRTSSLATKCMEMEPVRNDEEFFKHLHLFGTKDILKRACFVAHPDFVPDLFRHLLIKDARWLQSNESPGAKALEVLRELPADKQQVVVSRLSGRLLNHANRDLRLEVIKLLGDK